MNTQDDNDKDAALEQRSRKLFDDSVANLDAHTRSRLNQARQTALQTAQHQTSWGQLSPTMRRWVSIGSMAALALVAVVSWQFMRGDTTRDVQANGGMEDMEIVASANELDLLQNDVEFYDWFDSQDAAPAVNKAT